jgi:hypothetical protein
VRSAGHRGGTLNFELAARSGCDSGSYPDVERRDHDQAAAMFLYLLEHHHEADECAAVFASFKGHDSPLRRRPTVASCRSGGHAIWWRVEAGSETDALALLPSYIAARTTVTRVTDVDIP